MCGICVISYHSSAMNEISFQLPEWVFIMIFGVVMQFRTAFAQEYDSRFITTATMSARITNIGALDWYTDGRAGIRWLEGDYDVEFTHGLWVTGIMNDNLIGTSSSWSIDFSPGPIIDGQAAMLANHENEHLYRVYNINRNSSPGDPDYDEWPVQWGAPHKTDGTPLVYGDQTTYMVYNDAHPGEDYRGWPESDPTPLEIHETVWDYGSNPGLENVIFFRYQVYNRNPEDITNAALTLWTDIDLEKYGGFEWGGYNVNGNYMFNYYYHDNIFGFFPRACAYVLLQGPVVPEPGQTAIAFGQELLDARNLNTTSGWYVYDDDARTNPDTLAYFPYDLEQLRNVSVGLMLNGEPIIHPISGDTTTYTYDGDPITGEGWLWNLVNIYGGAGFITSSSIFELPAGDSTEAIFALIALPSDSFSTALTDLENQVQWLMQWWADNELTILAESDPNVPADFRLLNVYPNPFNASTNIQWMANLPRYTKLCVFNIKGEYVETIFSGNSSPGLNQTNWTPQDLASGQYILKLESETIIKNQKILLIK